MALKKSLVEVTHDEGYGDSLLMHINLAFGGKDMRADKIVNPVASAVQVEGIPEGWELVRVGKPALEEFIIGHDGSPVACVSLKRPLRQFRYAIIRKIEKPKRYRAFANAAEFEPHRDKWIKRSSKHDTEATRPEGCFRVTAYNDHHYWTSEGIYTPYMQAFDDGRCFEDGTPFGVEVVE